MRIVFIGPPGAGKGTQCQRLSSHFEIPHISSGEMLRATRGDTSLGQLIASYIDGGNLAPDDLVMEFITARLEQTDCRRGCLLDGFPRTIVQAERFQKLEKLTNRSVNAVVSLVAPEEVLVQRLLQRAQTESRADDTIETIRARLKVFEKRTAPVLDFYEQRNLVCSIDAVGAPDDIYETILTRLSDETPSS